MPSFLIPSWGCEGPHEEPWLISPVVESKRMSDNAPQGLQRLWELMAGGLSHSLFLFDSWSEAALMASLTWSSDCSSPRGDLPSPWRTPTSNTPCGCWTSRWPHRPTTFACPAPPKAAVAFTDRWTAGFHSAFLPETLIVLHVSDRQSRHQKIPLCSAVPSTRPRPPHWLVPTLTPLFTSAQLWHPAFVYCSLGMGNALHGGSLCSLSNGLFCSVNI